MDPQQRLILEHGYVAMHDAAMERAALAGSLTGVFLGIAGSEFSRIVSELPAGDSAYSATGSTVSVACGRLPYVFGLHGPCASYDTACSAALVALHAGLRALQLSECVAGVVPGMMLMLEPSTSVSFAIAGMTSARGRSHTFDARADGYARGEACGALALRCDVEGAELALQGSAVRQDGRSASLTAPNGQAQQGLLVAALADAGSSADAPALHEAHGTGTALGDPIEAGSLTTAVLVARTAPLTVSGVKANIGHAEAAAGMTGLLKLVLGLQHGEAASNAQLRVLNPHALKLGSMNCALPTQSSPLAKDIGAVGGVSSFGYAGTIAHTVLRQAELADGPPARERLRVVYTRRVFLWLENARPFAQTRLPPSSSRAGAYRSPCGGTLLALVADHVVLARVIFPAAGYLEMARAVLCAISTPPTDVVSPSDVIFMQPLELDALDVQVECTVRSGGFEIRSGQAAHDEADLDGEVTRHCMGEARAAGNALKTLDLPVRRAHCCAHVVETLALYQGLDSVGLEYGPNFRRLGQAWSDGRRAVTAHFRVGTARLAAVMIDPADLDGSLQLESIGSDQGNDGTQLPYAVDQALMHAGARNLWTVCTWVC